MTGNPDPFSVKESETSQNQSLFQNELLISDTHGHFAVSKASLSEEIPDELSVDSTDYDNVTVVQTRKFI